MDIQEVQLIAKHYDFRAQRSGESEAVYRRKLSDFLYKEGHVIEAHEVVSGRYETNKETRRSILGSVARAMDGRLKSTAGHATIGTAAGDMVLSNEDDGGLAAAILAAYAMGINPVDLFEGKK